MLTTSLEYLPTYLNIYNIYKGKKIVYKCTLYLYNNILCEYIIIFTPFPLCQLETSRFQITVEIIKLPTYAV